MSSLLQVYHLNLELSIYKPLLLCLVTGLACIALWLAVLVLTGKRRDKIRQARGVVTCSRRLMRRERFADEGEVQTEASSRDSDFTEGAVLSSQIPCL